MAVEFSVSDLRNLLHCESHFEFLQILLQLKTRRGKSYTYADLTRKFGFKSRSYAREMVLGKKPFPPTLTPVIVTTFGLNRDLKKFFELLLLKDDPSQFKILKKLRARLLESLDPRQSDLSYTTPEVPVVYAALGEKDRGATLAEISARTALQTEAIEESLKLLQHALLVKKVGTRFLPLEEHISFEGLKRSGAFKKHFQFALSAASRIAEKNFESERHLFFTSAFSVPKSRVPALKEDLHRLLLGYVDENETALGDQVISVVCSLY